MSEPIAYWREGYEEDEAKFRMDEMKRRLEVNQKTITRLRADKAELVEIAAEANFLCARLNELDWSQSLDELANQFNSHVDPPLSRLGRALETLNAQSGDDSADDLVADFRDRARICRTNADAFDTNAAAIWDMAADAAEKLSSRQPDLVEVEAADEITRLRAENERLRRLLKQTVHLARNYAQKPTGSIFEDAMREAEAALQETGDGMGS